MAHRGLEWVAIMTSVIVVLSWSVVVSALPAHIAQNCEEEFGANCSTPHLRIERGRSPVCPTVYVSAPPNIKVCNMNSVMSKNSKFLIGHSTH